MSDLNDLEKLRPIIEQIDVHLISLIAKRMELSRHVEWAKRPRQKPAYDIIHPDREDSRVAAVVDVAKRYGLNEDFARGIIRAIIDRSCHLQSLQRQQEIPNPFMPHEEDEAWYQERKKELLELTHDIAPRYDSVYYGPSSNYALKLYLEYENKILEESLQDLPGRGFALDLGCATGESTLRLAMHFDRVLGIDISPKMIEYAEQKKSIASENVSFMIHDFERGLSFLGDKSVDYIALTMGTASDFREVSEFLHEVSRVLKPGGKIFLSFYNADALLYRFKFLIWPASLNAEINPQKRSLEVHLTEKDVKRVYAKSYSLQEVRQNFTNGIEVVSTSTFPALSSVFPDHLLKEAAVQDAIKTIDYALSATEFGSYILVVAQKKV